MKKNIYIIFIFVLGVIPIGWINPKEESIKTDTIVWKENNKENRMYIYNPSTGDVKNKYTDEEHPYYMLLGEQIVFYAAYNQEEYNEAKNYVASTVYDNDGPILERSIYDIWDDANTRLAFGFRGSRVGKCKIVIHDKNDWGDALEEIYVQVVRADTIYVEDPYTKEYVENPGNLSIDKDEEVKVLSVMSGPLNMDGDVPSERFFYGSGYWSWETFDFTNTWTKLDNDKWLLTTKCKFPDFGNYTLNIGKNGNGTLGALNLHTISNKIQVDEIKIGDHIYKNINKNYASRMMNGVYTYVNSADNRYIVYVGDDLKISAPLAEGYHLDKNETEILKANSPNTDATKQTIYKANAPGNDEIYLKDSNNNIVETFYIEVKYPINVKTNLGEYHMNYVHEYIDTFDTLINMFHNAQHLFIADNTGEPLYIKNGSDYYTAYILGQNETVDITSYVKEGDTTRFIIGDGLEVIDEKEEEKDGFTKLSKSVKLTASEGTHTVQIGSETFYIIVRDPNTQVNHLDIEFQPIGNYTDVEAEKYENGKVIITKTLYSAYVTKNHGSKAYNKEKEEITTIEEGEYWNNKTSELSQFESTSAYVTNGNGILISESGKDITEDVKNGKRIPPFKVRNIPLSDIDSVKFYVDLKLVPISKTIITVPDSKNPNVSTFVTEDISNQPEKFLNNYEVEMNQRDIIDALNKCPAHNGLDFMITLSIETDIEKIIESLNINPHTKSTIFTIIGIIILSVITTIIYKKKRAIYMALFKSLFSYDSN